MNPVINCILERRSIRKYKPAQLKDSDLQIMLECAKYAPNGNGSQAWHFTAVQNAERLSRLNDLVKELLRGSDNELFRSWGNNPDYCFYYQAPTLVIVSVDDKKTDTPESDCALALENIFLAAHSLGLGSCWIHQLTWYTDAPSIRGEITDLGVPAGFKIYGCTSLGYADGDMPEAAARRENTVNIIK